MKVRKIIAWDLFLAVGITVIVTFVLDSRIRDSFAKDVYSVGVSVLSIVFAIYFAALSIIISSSDNEFVRFLEERGQFSELVSTFRFTLILLFVALVVAIGLYVYSAYIFANGGQQSKFYFSLFVFLTFYALFAVVSSALDALKFATLRARFLK